MGDLNVEKLTNLVERWNNFNTSARRSSTKGGITRLLNKWGRPQEIREAINSIPECPSWLKSRVFPGPVYTEGYRVFGWYYPEQLLAEELPLETDRAGLRVSLYGRMKAIWGPRGFASAVPLPLQDGVVKIETKEIFNFLPHGYAPPCPLQWHKDEEGTLWVDRSIINHGWRKAWSWYGENSLHWYLEKRPELFGDFDLWGESEPEPSPLGPRPGDLVLGGIDSESS
ncbi:MAG: hypothetical protein F6K21_05590 [Symploca sp. SIO2D2]|nr:hypothetical protein [Symploca sp. SIO2D2]